MKFKPVLINTAGVQGTITFDGHINLSLLLDEQGNIERRYRFKAVGPKVNETSISWNNGEARLSLFTSSPHTLIVCTINRAEYIIPMSQRLENLFSIAIDSYHLKSSIHTDPLHVAETILTYCPKHQAALEFLEAQERWARLNTGFKELQKMYSRLDGEVAAVCRESMGILSGMHAEAQLRKEEAALDLKNTIPVQIATWIS